MKNPKFLIVAVLLLAGCAGTKVYDGNGKVRFSTQADCDFDYRGLDGTTLSGTFNHSEPTIAGGNAVAEITDSAGRAVVGGILASTGASVVPKLAGGIAGMIPTKAVVKPVVTGS